MLDFTMLYSRIVRGWRLLLLQTGEVRNINYMHVTYVLGEMLLVWYFCTESIGMLTVCLLLHLFNFLVSLKDKARLAMIEDKRFIVRAYWGIEFVILFAMFVRNWQFALFHSVTSYLAPLFVLGVQNELLRIYFSSRRLPNFLRRFVVMACG